MHQLSKKTSIFKLSYNPVYNSLLIFCLPSHHILIFLTGQEEIEAFAKSARTIAKVYSLI